MSLIGFLKLALSLLGLVYLAKVVRDARVDHLRAERLPSREPNAPPEPETAHSRLEQKRQTEKRLERLRVASTLLAAAAFFFRLGIDGRGWVGRVLLVIIVLGI